jgi:signal transduction histidine kinase/ActR/RegA family two-component response regulator
LTESAVASAADSRPGASAEREARIEHRIAERRLDVLLHYARRLPMVYAGYLLVALVATQQGLGIWQWVWLACTWGVGVHRYRVAQAVERAPAETRLAGLRRLENGFTANGLVTAPIVPFVYWSIPTNAGPLLIGVMLIVGCAISVASLAGSRRAFVGYATLTFAFIAIGWLIRGGTLGISLGVGMCIMYALLLGTVKDQARSLKELMSVVDDNAVLSESVRQERDRATAASEAKTRFFAAASHDLRQPLHALSINATTLDILARRSTDSLLKEVSRGIGSALRQSSGLLDGLLDISRLDAHTIEAKMAPHDIGAVLRASRDEYAALAAQQGLYLKLEVPDEPLWGLTDGDQLIRIIGNLVNNAMKFTTAGGVTLSARRMPAGTVVVKVSDTGPGIPEGERERVFEEFYQIGNPSRDRAQGLGLGLAIVQRTAKLLDITLRLDSEPGRGTTFELQIAPAEPAGELSPESTGAFARSLDGTSLAVLLVDDEAEVLSAMGTYLQQLGWSVKGVATGDEAEQALLDGFEPDVMVVDFRLREETGVDVIERLRARKPDLPAVIVTGETAPSRFREFSGAAARILHKPLDGDRLARALQEVVLGNDVDDEAPAAGANVTPIGKAAH